MKGYRTLIFAAVQVLFGIAAMLGYVTPEGADEALASHVETIIGGSIAAFGIVSAWLRSITDTPVGVK